MKLNRINNTFRNMTSGLVNKGVTLLLPFLIRTTLIKTVGIEYAGLNSLFSSILQVLNLTELGFSSAVVFSMYKPIAQNNTKQINALLAFYRKIYRTIGFIVLIIGILLLPILPKMVNGGYPKGINIYVLYMVYLINTVISYFLFAYKSAILNAHQRVDIANNILTITQGAMNIVQILVLLVFKNYYCYIIWMPVFTIINNLLTAHFTNKMFPQYHCEGKIDSEQLLDMKYKVGGLMVNKLCLTTRNTFDSIFISAFLGLTVSAIYGNYYYIMTAVIGIVSVISSSMLAGIGNSIQTDSVEKNYNDLKKFNFLYMWLSGWCTICMLCLIQPFMIIWMGKENLFPFGVVILFCLYFYILKMGDMRGLYSEAAGLWWQNRYRAILESLANLILNFVMVKIWGIYGIISATLITLLLINFVGGSGIVFKYYFKNKKLTEFFKDHLFYFVITVGNAILTLYVINKIEISGIVGLFIKGVVCMVVPNIVYSIFYLTRKELKHYFQWLYEKLF